MTIESDTSTLITIADEGTPTQGVNFEDVNSGGTEVNFDGGGGPRIEHAMFENYR